MSGRVEPDPRVEDARAIPIAEVAARLGADAGLKRVGQELVGPCPECGGTDRFAIDPRKNLYNCRSCGGGDGIALVRLVQRCEFPEALAFLAGEREDVRDPEVERRRREARERRRREQEAEAERYRRDAIRRARTIWDAGRPAPGTPVEAYLALRGLTPARIGGLPRALRFHPDLRYSHRPKGGAWTTIHRGPAMLAGILAPDGRLSGVHRTWIDLSRPDGKAAIVHEGEALAAKKVEGSKKGGAIRLTGPDDPRAIGTLVMAEGIETTLSAVAAGALPEAAFWCGVDLGNMGGRRASGPGLKYAGLPDMADRDAFVPPPNVRRLVFVQDRDSEPRLTRAKLEAGLRRAAALRPGLSIEIVRAAEGRDLNDMLRGAA